MTTERAEKPGGEEDGVLRRDRLRALRARSPLLFHCRRTSPKMVGDGRITPSLSALNTRRFYDAIPERLPRRPLRRAPGRPLARGAGRARCDVRGAMVLWLGVPGIVKCVREARASDEH